jgi:hypothetical protein
LGDPDTVLLQRHGEFKRAAEKKKAAAAEARKKHGVEEVIATEDTRKSGRKRKRTAKAQVYV